MFANNARINGRQAVQNTTPVALWTRNGEFLKKLDNIINNCHFVCHPIFQTKNFHFPDDKAWVKRFYLSATRLTDTVTNAVIRVLSTSVQLQSRLGIKAVYSARFLLQINLLDELGFRFVDDHRGHPALSHCMLFIETLSQVGVDIQELETFQPTHEEQVLYRCFETNYNDYLRLICILALFDTVFLKTIAEWLLEMAGFYDINVSRGYYSIPIDDGASDDTRYLFQQALVPERYNEMWTLVEETLEIWAVWSDQLLIE
jgi:hypothetical protein